MQAPLDGRPGHLADAIDRAVPQLCLEVAVTAAEPRRQGPLDASATSADQPERVEYLCVASTHAPRSLERGSGLTRNNGGWAYCPAGATADHRWFETGGVEIAGLAVEPGIIVHARPAIPVD